LLKGSQRFIKHAESSQWREKLRQKSGPKALRSALKGFRIVSLTRDLRQKQKRIEQRPDGLEEHCVRGALRLRQKPERRRSASLPRDLRVGESLAGETKIITLIFALALACISAGCATEKVAVDLTTYVNQGVMNITELEQKSLTRYASVTGSNYKNDQTTYEALRDYVIPLYKRFIRGLRALQPETEEVRNLNRIYIDGADTMLEGFKLILLAIETQDASLIRPANDYLEKGRLDNERWRKELIALSEKYDVKIVGTEETSGSVLDIFVGGR
jgi:hypothetical protein